MAYENKVVKSLKTRTVDGFSEPTYIGAEQRFIGGIRSGNINNLEEQLIIGTDTYTFSDIDENNNKITTKLFCPVDENGQELENVDEYYQLVTTEFGNGMNEHYYFDDNTLKLSNYFHDSYFGNGTGPDQDINTIYFVNDESMKFHFVESTKSFLIQPPIINTKKDELKFIKKTNSNEKVEIDVLVKETAIINNDSHRSIVREKIINKLKGE